MAEDVFDLVDFMSKVGVGGVTGIIAAYFTAKVTLNRFYHEKWWEKKHAAYNQLVDMLIEMRLIYARASSHYQRVRESERNQNFVDSDDYQFDWSRFYDLNSQVRRSYVLAPISLSEDTKVLLTKYFEEDEQVGYSVHKESYPQEVAYGEMADVVEKLIDALVADAQKELKFR